MEEDAYLRGCDHSLVTMRHPIWNLLLVALVITAFYLGRNLLIPFIMALFVWYLINALRGQIARIKPRGVQLPKRVQWTVSVLSIIGFFWLIGRLIVQNLEEFETIAPEYNRKIGALSIQLGMLFDISSVEEFSSRIDLPSLVTNLLNSSFSFLVSIVVVLFYVIFIVLEQRVFSAKMSAIFGDSQRREQFFTTVEKIDASMRTYLSVKAFISLLVALSTYLLLIGFGVDFAVLWGVLAFLLNFIPYVGSFISIVFPSVIAILQFDSPLISPLIFGLLMVIQVVFGNLIEPKIVGKSLNLSPLVVVISLAFWGTLWGVAGMFLCVPITVTLMIILNQFPKTRSIAILLSAGNGEEEAT